LTVCWPCWPSVDHVWNVDWVLTMCRLSVGHLAPVGCQLGLSATCTSFVGTALISDFRLVICDKERWTRWFVETKNTISSIMGHNTNNKSKCYDPPCVLVNNTKITGNWLCFDAPSGAFWWVCRCAAGVLVSRVGYTRCFLIHILNKPGNCIFQILK